MRKREILVVEDDSSIAPLIKKRLERDQEFEVRLVVSGTAGLRSISTAVPDATVIDTSVRDVPAEEICRVIRLRRRTARLPIILIGSKTAGLSLVDGLALGADDYVTKPIDVEELTARLKAVLRRHVHQPAETQEEFRSSRLYANFADVHIAVDGAPISLTKREFELLRFLVRRRNEVLAREEILTNVWGANGWDPRIVDSAMWKLRKKIGLVGKQIETVTGFGYRFNEDEVRASQSARRS